MFDWITSFIESAGYPGIALLMFAENLFPPIPSELIMPLAGFTAASGDLNIVAATVAGTIGSLLGVLFWFVLARKVGAERLKRFAARHGRLLTLAPDDVDSACAWFSRHGHLAVFFGRLVPGVRTLISIPAGVAEMSLTRFLAYSTAGTAIWTALLAAAGYLLEDSYQKVADWLNPISNVIIGGLVVAYLYRVVTFRRPNSAA